MGQNEFSFIERYFTNLNKGSDLEAKKRGLVLGIGDDAAVMRLDGAYSVTTDTMIEGVHFFSDCRVYVLGRRALEVNFSDLYAMGAIPEFVTLSLSMPRHFAEFEGFWRMFTQGFEDALKDHDCMLIGGNTTSMRSLRDPLCITVTAFGRNASERQVMRRDAAKCGDVIVCTGSQGVNAMFVDAVYSGRTDALSEDERSTLEVRCCFYPPVMGDFVKILRKHCRCCIDVSDGLLGDLSHMLVSSGVGADIDSFALHQDPWIREVGLRMGYTEDDFRRFALTGGGDYNLLFTLSEESFEKLRLELSENENRRCSCVRLNRIGEITERRTLRGKGGKGSLCVSADAISVDGRPFAGEDADLSFNHFAGS